MLVDAVETGEIAERRLAQVSDAWATVPELNMGVEEGVQ
jgi:hypothetical protein